MKIARFNIFQYRLPLYHPIMIHGKTLKIREGLIIKLTNEQGIFAYGEITPLPVLCQESLDSVRNQAIELSRVLRGQSIPKGVEKLEGKFESWLGAYHLWPSLRFGLEMAVLK